MPAPTPAEPAGGNGDDDDASLLATARRGDAVAFGALVRRHQSTVRRQLRHLMHGNDGVADELAQDTFVLAWRRIGEFRGEARLATWLHRIAYRRFLMHLRSEAARVETSEAGDPGDAEPQGAGTGPSDVDVEVARRLDVERALGGLSEAQRLALFHCFQLDLSHEEAADVLGMPIGTLKSHVARGKARLREALAAWAPARLEQP